METSGLAPTKKLGFGCMRLPLADPDDTTSVDVAQFEQMIDEFLAAGFTYFDTAYMYHNHTSETFVRQALVRRHARDEFTLATKLPCMSLIENGTPQDMQRIFDEQLEKCGVEFFDYYLLHNLNAKDWPCVQKLDAFGFASALKEQGKIRHLGFSFHDSPELLDEILTAHPEVEFVQLQINYLDWDDPSICSRANYEVVRKHGKKVIVMEPVKGGALAKVPERAEVLLRGARPDLSCASWGIRYAASLPDVMCVLSGMSTLEQLRDNVGYMGDFEPLSDDERQVLDQAALIVKQSNAIACTSCHYCEENCPQGIPIPAYFTLYNEELASADRENDRAARDARYRELAGANAPASACVECNACADNCPQHLPIPELLKKIVRRYE